MKKDDYTKATEIQEQIKKFQKLRDLCPVPYKKFTLIKKTLCMGNYNSTSISICDDGLTEVIRDYCDRRIQELRDEMDAL